MELIESYGIKKKVAVDLKQRAQTGTLGESTNSMLPWPGHCRFVE